MSRAQPDEFALEAFRFCEEVNALKNKSSIGALTYEAMRCFGFSHVTCAVVPPPGQSPLGSILLNNRPVEYLQRYAEKNYACRDPVVVELKKTLSTFSWSDVKARRRLSRDQYAIMGEAADFGATDGLIIPIVSTAGSISIFAPCGNNPLLTARARSAVEIIGIAAHQALRRASVPLEVSRSNLLSGREREVLQWLAVGKSVDEIGDILTIGVTTVRTHVDNAKKKLNATKGTLAVVEALRRGEISL